MAVKPWNQITTTQEAVEYINAEIADAAACPPALSSYMIALATAQSGLLMDWEVMRSSVEGQLNTARGLFNQSGCTKPSGGGGGGVDPGAGDEYGGGGGGGGYTGAGIAGGGIGTLLLLAAGGLAIYLMYGKKGKGGKGKARKSSRRRR
jgi:uncharacterized membrane protein